MLKHEFEELVGYEVTQADYDAIEEFYLEDPQDKFEFAYLWKKEGDGVLLLEAVRRLSAWKKAYNERTRAYIELEDRYEKLKNMFHDCFKL